MKIRISCPYCDQHIEATGEVIGANISCPTCKKEFEVGQPVSRARPKRTTAKKLLLVSILICVGILLIIILSFAASFSSSAPIRSLSLFGPKPTPVLVPAVVSIIEVIPAKNADERLFLMRLLEEMYSEWPTDLSHPEDVQKTLSELRYRANRHYEDIKQRNVDDTIASLYQDFIASIDAYKTFLANIGKINSDAVAREEKEKAESGFDAGYIGAQSGFEAHDNGATNSGSILTGAGAAFITYLWQEYNNSQARDSAKSQAMEEATQNFKNQLSTYRARLQNAAPNLEEKYSWQKGEAGFDELSSQAMAILDANTPNNLAKYLQVMDAEQQKRPRDPFVLWNRAYMASLDKQRTPAELLLLADQCLKAAALVPAGRIYDEYRSLFLYRAGDVANRASSEEIGNKSWAAACNPTAAYAVGIWDECLKFSPDDSTGEIRERRAWALMQSGHLKEALDQARAVESLRQKTKRFAYIYSCLLSSLSETADAYKWFDYDVRTLGDNHIEQAKSDPDLQAMRIDQKTKFDELTTIQWACHIDYGNFYWTDDDIIVTNNSPFALTNVVLRCSITPNDRTANSELKADRIEVGQSYKWADVAHVPGSKIDPNSSATLTSDQNKDALTQIVSP